MENKIIAVASNGVHYHAGDVVEFHHNNLNLDVIGIVYFDMFGCGIYFGNIDHKVYGECIIRYAEKGNLRHVTSNTLTPKVRTTIDWMTNTNPRLAEFVEKANAGEYVDYEEVKFNENPDEEVIYPTEGFIEPYPQDMIESEHEDWQNTKSFDEFFNNMLSELGHGNNQKSA